MANNNDLPGETLEGRYITDHVGGAFNAKVIKKPRPTSKVLEDATLGSVKANKSLLVSGLDTERYGPNEGVGSRNISRKPEPSGKGKPGFGSRPFIPTPAKPFIPAVIPTPPTVIYWNTNPDVWDDESLDGQIYWDS